MDPFSIFFVTTGCIHSDNSITHLKKIFDHIIVGQGIAGTTLAAHLLERGRDVLVIDNHHHRSSSLVAAGKWNPVVFRTLNKSWMIDDLLPYALDFYGRWENRLGRKFVHHHKNIRIFNSPGEQNMWYEKSGDPAYSEYISVSETNPLNPEKFHTPHGIGIVHKGGHVDLDIWLNGFRRYLDAGERIVNSSVDPYAISTGKSHITVDGINTRTLIFAEGHQAKKNPWFENLPLKDTKGELIIFRSEELKLEHVVSKGFFILPVGNDLYIAGATFKWKDSSPDTTAEAREELVEKIKSVTPVSFEVVDQKAGVRPSSGDRRPIMGPHPNDERVGIFNGFGAKGVILAPYWAGVYAENLIDRKEIPELVHIGRFRGW